MKNLIIVLSFVFSLPAMAETWITSPVFTYHADRTQGNGKPWNENQHKDGPAFGLEFGSSKKDAPTIIIGKFQNSFDRPTMYAGVKWEPVQIGPLGVGAVAGFASGYARPFIGGLSTSLTDRNGNGIVAIWAPKVGPGTSAFVSIQARALLW
jgi:hypothetical protein